MSTRISIAAAVLITALAAATPALAQTRPEAKPDFNVVGLGDSFASGEGAPDVAGEHSNGGRVTGQPEIWDATVPATSEAFLDADDCHRSPRAGAAVAARLLAGEFPEVDVEFRSFACSGATTVDGIVGPFEFLAPDSGIRPKGTQLTKLAQVRQARNAFGTTPIDAVVMNIGGNDANFKEIVKRCFNVPVFFVRCDTGDRGEKTLEIFDNGLQTLNGRYDKVARALASTGLAGEEELAVPARKVILTAVPNLATGNGNQPCDGETADNFADNLVRDESIFLRENVFEPLIAEFERAADEHGWVFADGVIGNFAGHGICATDNFINTNLEAIHRQGEDSASAGWPGVALSSGFTHPNYKGQEAYADAILPKLRGELRAKFTPSPVRPVPHALERDPATGAPTAIVLRFEGGQSEFEVHHEVKLVGAQGNALTTVIAGEPGATELRVPLPAAATPRFLVLARSCGPLKFERSCTPFSAPRPVSLIAPPAPTGLELSPGRPASPFVPGPDAALTAAWEFPAANPDLRRFVVTTGGKAFEAAGPLRRAAVLTGLTAARSQKVEVAACSDFECSAPLIGAGAPGTGTFEFFKGLNDPAVLVSPALGSAAVTPARVHTRAGGTARLTLAWTHPLNWNELERVELRLRAGRRIAGRVIVAGDRLRAAGTVRLLRGRLHKPGIAGRTLTADLVLRVPTGGRFTLDLWARDRLGLSELSRGVGTLGQRTARLALTTTAL
jgi:hypothetical protein